MRSIALVTSLAVSLPNFRGSLIRALVDAGFRVYALAPDFDDDIKARVRALGGEPIDISLDRAGLKPFRDLRDMIALTRLLRRLKPDITFAYFIKPVLYGGTAAWLAAVPRHFAMIEGLGYIFSSDGQSGRRHVLRGLVERFYGLAFRKARKVFFLNDEDMDIFVGPGRLPAAKAINLGGIGVELEKFEPAPAVAAPVTFTLAARLLREKGIHEFAEAARRVRAVRPEARFLLLGGTDANPDSVPEATIRGWVDEGILEWPGLVSDVRSWLAQTSVFVLPSYYREGVPRSIQEAMAMARPIITTDNVGCRDTVDEGVNGFKVPVRDSVALAQAMIRFLEQPALIARMGGESRRLAETRFDARKVDAVILRELGVR